MRLAPFSTPPTVAPTTLSGRRQRPPPPTATCALSRRKRQFLGIDGGAPQDVFALSGRTCDWRSERTRYSANRLRVSKAIALVLVHLLVGSAKHRVDGRGHVGLRDTDTQGQRRGQVVDLVRTYALGCDPVGDRG